MAERRYPLAATNESSRGQRRCASETPCDTFFLLNFHRVTKIQKKNAERVAQVAKWTMATKLVSYSNQRTLHDLTSLIGGSA